MINLELTRFSFGVEATLGVLHDISGGGRDFLCFTLEDEPREVKVPGETCIPAGTYELAVRDYGGFHERYSDPHSWANSIHRGMLEILNVEGFSDILIHTGNRDEHTRGCILVGDGATQNVTEEGALQSSRAAYRRIYPPLIAAMLDLNERVVLHIRETWG